MKNRITFVIIAILVIVYFIILFSYQSKYPQLKWNWDKIDTENIYFPKDFLWGVSTAAHQVEGNNTNNQWYVWENSVDGERKTQSGRWSEIRSGM
jgi:beta-glucosidase